MDSGEITNPASSPRFGEFGGMYVPQILLPALDQLAEAFEVAKTDLIFQKELTELLTKYAGRPTPLYRCRNLVSHPRVRVYLKREDLLHGGAHKTNQVLGQALLAQRMGKRRIIAETGAGQHGVATAMMGALFGFETEIYMGAKDVERQALNVFRMELMGAKVIPVSTGNGTLKDAINEAMRDWSASYETTHYLLGTVAGPHPFPSMVAHYQRIIGDEARAQIMEAEGRLPDYAIACVGGGSNAVGLFKAFVEDAEVKLVGVEPAGHGLHTQYHGATLGKGRPGILHGAHTYVMQDEDGQIQETHSVSAGLDYPGVGPEHAHLMTSGRAEYVAATDEEALTAFKVIAEKEGILSALETAHAVAHVMTLAEHAPSDKDTVIVMNMSGRGDKDVSTVKAILAKGAQS